MNFKQAVIDLIKYCLIYVVDTGDRGLNAAIILVLAISVEIIVGFVEPYMALWPKYRYQRDVAALPTGLLPIERSHSITKTHGAYINDYLEYGTQIDNVEIIKHPMFVKHFTSLVSYTGLLSSNGTIDKISDYLCKYYGINKDYKTVSTFPIFKVDNSLVWMNIPVEGGNINNITISRRRIDTTLPSDKISDVIRAMLQSTLDTTTSAQVLSVKPTIVSKDTIIDVILRTKLPTNSYFIHRDRDHIRMRLLKFNSSENPHLTNATPMNFGITLYGKPGRGKTTFVAWMCSLLGRNCIDIKLRDPGWNATYLQKIFTTPEHVIGKHINEIVYFLDEFDLSGDCLTRDTQTAPNVLNNITIKNADTLTEFRKVDLESKDIISLSTLLTAFDGIHRVTGRIIVVCTNRIECIDRALLRPGRLGDLCVELGDFGPVEIAQAFELYKNVPADSHERINKITAAINPAEFMHAIHTKSPEEVLTSLGV